MKREKREVRVAASSSEQKIATSEDLEGYGFASDEPEPEAEES